MDKAQDCVDPGLRVFEGLTEVAIVPGREAVDVSFQVVLLGKSIVVQMVDEVAFGRGQCLHFVDCLVKLAFGAKSHFQERPRFVGTLQELERNKQIDEDGGETETNPDIFCEGLS